jgi:hypothetical protein
MTSEKNLFIDVIVYVFLRKSTTDNLPTLINSDDKSAIGLLGKHLDHLYSHFAGLQVVVQQAYAVIRNTQYHLPCCMRQHRPDDLWIIYMTRLELHRCHIFKLSDSFLA